MPNCLTVPAKGLREELLSVCYVASAFDPAIPKKTRPDFLKATAIWDTGATHSVVSNRLVKLMKMKHSGWAVVQNTHSKRRCKTYLVNFALSGGIFVSGITASTQKLSAGYDVLIGIDVLQKGDFAVTHFNKKTVFTFRVPSMEAIDFNG